MTKLTHCVLFSLLAACSGTVTDDAGGGTTRDVTSPLLEIDSPARGTMVEGVAVTVTGRVTDAESAIAEVRVNGQVATLTGDNFSLELTGSSGINVLETQATDAAGNVAIDDRAVLIGELADQGTPITDGIVTRIDGTAMDALGAMVSEVADNTNFTALATALNPVVDTGDGCNSAKVFVESISKSGVPVAAGPTAGGIATEVSVEDLEVRGRVTFRAVCIGGSASFTITAASYDVGGRIRPTLVGGDLQVALDGVTSAFTDFSLDVGGIPGFVENLFAGQVRDKLADILRDQVQAMVPQLATSFLADFLADDWQVPALGQTINLSIRPTQMTWDAGGGRIALETRSTIEGVEGASFLSTPTAAPVDLGADGLAVALADDVANQLLAGMWASGALEVGYSPGDGDPVRAFFGEADRVTVKLSLPPVIDADTTTGTMTLAVGDVIVEVIDDDGGAGTLAELAISAELDLSATLTAAGEVMLQTGSPRVVGQVLTQAAGLAVPLDRAKVAAFAELAIKKFAGQTDDLLRTLPIPGVPGAAITAPTFEPRGGYVVLGGTLSVP